MTRSMCLSFVLLLSTVNSGAALGQTGHDRAFWRAIAESDYALVENAKQILRSLHTLLSGLEERSPAALDASERILGALANL